MARPWGREAESKRRSLKVGGKEKLFCQSSHLFVPDPCCGHTDGPRSTPFSVRSPQSAALRLIVAPQSLVLFRVPFHRRTSSQATASNPPLLSAPARPSCCASRCAFIRCISSVSRFPLPYTPLDGLQSMVFISAGTSNRHPFSCGVRAPIIERLLFCVRPAWPRAGFARGASSHS